MKPSEYREKPRKEFGHLTPAEIRVRVDNNNGIDGKQASHWLGFLAEEERQRAQEAIDRIEGMKMGLDMRIAHGKSLMAVLNEACKASIVINGGAAVAMGALIQAIWDRGGLVPLRTVLMYGIAITCFGVALGASTFILRYFSLGRAETMRDFANGWGLAAFVAGIASLLTFVIGLGIPLVAGFRY